MWNMKNHNKKLSLEFIAGLVVGEGTFYWTKNKNGLKTPAFALRMHVRDLELVTDVRDSLKLSSRVYEYTHDNRHYVYLLVRNPWELKAIIRALYPRLYGYKKEQFVYWFHRFGDEDVSPNYRFLFSIFKKEFPDLYIID